jgi:signal transduction histidine kinase
MADFSNITLRSKLIIIQSVTAFVAVLFCCTVFVVNDINTFKESSVRNISSIAEVIGVNSASPLLFMDKDAANKILSNLKNNPAILNAEIFDKTGKRFVSFTKKGEEDFIFQIPKGRAKIKPEFTGAKFLVNYNIYQDHDFLGTLILNAELIDLNAIIYNYLKIAGFVLLAGIMAAVFISIILQRAISTRLLLLVSNAKEIAETGNYTIRVKSEGKDEIGVLSKGFNTMLEKIEKSESELKEINLDLERRVKDRTNELNESNLKLTNSNKELEQFAYVSSHDLQEPLRTISNFVELLEKKYAGKLDKDGVEYFNFIIKATSRMKNLITDLLEFSRVGRDISFEPVDCNLVLNEVIEEMSTSIKESNAHINISKLPVLRGNKTELRRLFLNLISNAIKFRKKNVAPEITIAVEEKKSEFLFSVKDNGIGIEAQFINKLFIIFQRLHSTEKYPGTGIGLATCNKIVSLHKGKIWVESEPDVGSIFYFTISKRL